MYKARCSITHDGLAVTLGIFPVISVISRDLKLLYPQIAGKSAPFKLSKTPYLRALVSCRPLPCRSKGFFLTKEIMRYNSYLQQLQDHQKFSNFDEQKQRQLLTALVQADAAELRSRTNDLYS